MEEPVVHVVDAADSTLVDEVVGLTSGDPQAPRLSDGRTRALRAVARGGDVPGFVAALARRPEDGRLIAYAQADRSEEHGDDQPTATVELAVPEALSGGPAGAVETADLLLEAVVDAIGSRGGTRLRLWVHDAGTDDDRRAGAFGFVPERELLQMRCHLPIPDDGRPADPEVVTRAFRVGRDEEAWLAVNNRAFDGHPEQGGWDLDTLRTREKEPWFDADGFRVLELDGAMVGSCWTRIHRDTDPAMGEIFVISVDPGAHGHGWGRALTRDGLRWLADGGLTTGMLYVDSANAAAVALYRSMGFAVHHVDRAYLRPVLPDPAFTANR